MTGLGTHTRGGTSSGPRGVDPARAGDLRRRRRAELADHLLERAAWLPDADRQLIDAVYRRGQTAVELGALLGLPARSVRRRVKRLVERLLDPRTAFVATRRDQWPRTRRIVAERVVLRGQSMRAVARELAISLHAVRRQVDAIQNQFEGAETEWRHAKQAR